MKQFNYPVSLLPDHRETYSFNNSEYEIPVTNLAFKRWEGPAILNTFGGKPLVDYEGAPLFAELAIQRMAAKDGWSARWVEAYAAPGKNPYYFTDWLEASLKEQAINPLGDLKSEEWMTKIAEANGSFSGCWDVLAWKDERLLFLESKRRKKDSVRATQLKWLEASLSTGLSLDNFLIVQWDFAE